jgi:hypothetical protein
LRRSAEKFCILLRFYKHLLSLFILRMDMINVQ